MIQSGQPPRFEGKFVVATDPSVHDVIGAVKPSSPNHHHPVDQILDVGGARPDIIDGAHSFTHFEVAVHGTQEAVFAGAIDPSRSDDVAAAAGLTRCLFAVQFGPAVDVDRRWLIPDRVRRAIEGFACECVLRAEMNDFRASPICRFRQKPRTFDVHRRGFFRIELRIVDLEHGAIDNQIRFGIRNAAFDCRGIGNIEGAVRQGQYFMFSP